MSFMDSVSSTLNSGAAKAGKMGQIAKLSVRAGSLEQRRESLLGQLGACVYHLLRDSPELVPAARELVDDIARLDAEVAGIRSQIDEAKAEVTASAREGGSGAAAGAAWPPAASGPAADEETVVCPRCGSVVAAGSKFCMECGLPMEGARHTAGATGEAASGAGRGAQAEAAAPRDAPVEAEPLEPSAPVDTPPTEPGPVAPEPVDPAEAAPAVAEPVEPAEAEPAVAEPAEPAEPAEAAVVEPQIPAQDQPESQLQPEPAPVGGFCPECGTPVGPTDRFCMNCGRRLL